MQSHTSPSIAPRRGLVYSDVRLKREVLLLDKLDNGINIYRFQYRWSGAAYVGVMAQEVAAIEPEAVSQDADGYFMVDYRRLGLQLRTYQDWLNKGHFAPVPPNA